MKQRAWHRFVWIAAGALVLVLLVRTFVADLYRVQSGSMEPTILGGEPYGEWVLVRYSGAGDLERFDLAVVYEGDGNPIVKRVVGLPGENVQVREGDLFVDGARVAHHVPRPPLIPLFDASVAAAEDHSALAADPGTWVREGGAWRIDNWELHAESSPDYLRWNTGVDDGYLLPNATRVHGQREVRDAGVEFELEWIELDGEFLVELREAGDCFRARIVPVAYSRNRVEHAFRVSIERLRLRLTQSGAETREELVDREVLAEGEVPHEFGERASVHFSNVDDALYLVVDELALVASYGENRELEGAGVAPGGTVGPRIALGADSTELVVHGLRVLRDLAWISRGNHASERPVTLGPGELFLLGDNSAHSLDGRTWGPTRHADVLGRPSAVVWPPDRARPLRGPRWRRVDRRPGE